ncbi:MAG: hypothetical protein WKF91_18350 [Segetibacter sp.]
MLPNTTASIIYSHSTITHLFTMFQSSLRIFKLKLWLPLALLSTQVVIAQKIIIKVNPAANLGQIQPELYGTNHRYTNNGSTMWDSGKHAAIPAFLKVYNEIGLRSMRYPAGTAASLFHWKRSICPLKDRTDAIEGHSWEDEIRQARTNFGLDEALRFCEANNTKLNYMYNFGNGNAADAADLVEYLNTPVGKNPNGGIAWAEVRSKNGHPQPYNIVTFEMGNEMTPRPANIIGSTANREKLTKKNIALAIPSVLPDNP